MKTTGFKAAAFVLALLIGCAQGGSGGSSSATLASNINLNLAPMNAMYTVAGTGTAMRFPIGLTSAYADSGSDAGLYALGSNGSLNPVSLTTGPGGNSQTVISSPNFIAVQTTNIVNSAGVSCGLVTINKSTGTTDCIGTTLSTGLDFYKALQADGSGNNLFFLDSMSHLYKLNMNTGSVSIIESNFPVFVFSVNTAGDVLVQYWTGTDLSTAVLTVYLVGGGTQQIVTGTTGTITTINGSGQTNNFYYASSPAACGSPYCTLTKSGSTFTNAAAGFTVPMCAQCFEYGAKSPETDGSGTPV